MGPSAVVSSASPSGTALGDGAGSVSASKGAAASPVVVPPAVVKVVDSNGAGSAGGKKNKNKKKKAKSKLVSEVEKIRDDIQATLQSTSGGAADFDLDKMPGAMEKLTQMEAEIKNLTEQIKKWGPILERLDAKNSGSQQQQSSGAQSQVKAGGDAGGAGGQKKSEAKPATADDDIDLFGSDEEEEDEEAKKLREERLAAYDTKKAKKPALIAKSSIVLEVKPWDDETDVHEMEKAVRSIEMDGLLWGASKFVEIAYGIKKLQISAVVEDDKVSVDLLEEKITDFEELVQSVDIASFNKI